MPHIHGGAVGNSVYFHGFAHFIRGHKPAAGHTIQCYLLYSSIFCTSTKHRVSCTLYTVQQVFHTRLHSPILSQVPPTKLLMLTWLRPTSYGTLYCAVRVCKQSKLKLNGDTCMFSTSFKQQSPLCLVEECAHAVMGTPRRSAPAVLISVGF